MNSFFFTYTNCAYSYNWVKKYKLSVLSEAILSVPAANQIQNYLRQSLIFFVGFHRDQSEGMGNRLLFELVKMNLSKISKYIL